MRSLFQASQIRLYIIHWYIKERLINAVRLKHAHHITVDTLFQSLLAHVPFFFVIIFAVSPLPALF